MIEMGTYFYLKKKSYLISKNIVNFCRIMLFNLYYIFLSQIKNNMIFKAMI